MSKSFQNLWEEVNQCIPTGEPVTDKEAGSLIARFKKVFNIINVDFNFSGHFIIDRLNDSRNRPMIAACEFDKVLTKFIQKMSKQLRDDVWDIENRKVQPRGKRTEQIRPNNYEYGVVSKSTGLAIILALQPNPKGRNKVRVNIVTIMRKKGFHVNQGEEIMVEGVAYDTGNVVWVEID